jgi:hypothetical protein
MIFCELFYNTVSNKTIYHWMVGQQMDDLEESSYSLIKVLSQQMLGETEKTMRNLSQDSWCPGQH